MPGWVRLPPAWHRCPTLLHPLPFHLPWLPPSPPLQGSVAQIEPMRTIIRSRDGGIVYVNNAEVTNYVIKVGVLVVVVVLVVVLVVLVVARWCSVPLGRGSV